jgi:hypothetical protein
MAALHPHLFQTTIADESKIRKLIANHFLVDRTVLQWRPAADEDIPTPNTNEIVVFYSFQRGFSLPAGDFFYGLIDHYQIELVHLNPNFILQIAIFIHHCEAFPGIPPNFPLFISPVPGFDDDILISAILVLARPLGDESTSDPCTEAGASALKTQATKRKASANPTPQKKSRKTTGKSAGRIKINEPAPKTLVLTPPLGPQWKIPIQHSKRYTHHKYISFLMIFNS